MSEKRSWYFFCTEILSLILLVGFFIVGKWHSYLLFSAVCLHIITQELIIKAKKTDILRQLSILNIGIAFVLFVLSVKGKEMFELEGQKSYFFFCIFITISCFALGIQGFLLCKGIKRKCQGIIIFLVLGLVCAVAVWDSSAEARWDGAILYNYLQGLNVTSIFNINNLSFFNHISMSYISINLIAGTIFGSLKISMAVLNIGLYLASVWCVYLISKMYTKISDGEAAMLSAVYAVSPFLLGLVNYNYWDYWVSVLFPIVVYFALSKKWVYFLFSSLVFCFTKETAVVSYAFFCLGLLLTDFFQMNGNPDSKRDDFKQLLQKKEYYGMLAVGIIWLYIYIRLPNWGGTGAFTIDRDYILDKLAVLFGLNFNWVLALVGAVLSIFLIKQQKKEVFKIIFPLVCSDLGFILFSCLFQTVNHARYIDAHIAALNLIVIVSLAALESKVLKSVTAFVLIGMMLLSNYRTVDPVTLHLFEQHNVGETIIVSTAGREFLSDSIVYNRQYLYFDRALNNALEDVVSEENLVICFPALNGNIWFFDGNGGWSSLGNDVLIMDEYWDLKWKKRTIHETDECIPLQVYQLTKQANLEEILGDKTGYYFYMPEVGDNIYRNIEENLTILEKDAFEYRGWVINRIKFSAD